MNRREAVTGHLLRIGRQWQRLREFFDAPPGADAPPLELSCAVLDELERRVQPVGGGRRVFPYDRIVVRLSTVNADRPALEAAFQGLGSRLRARLEELRCEAPDAIDVEAVFLNEPAAEWPSGRAFSIECVRTGGTDCAEAHTEQSALHIAVVSGTATEPAYRFSAPVIFVGRTVEATDDAGRVRRNDVAFFDTVDGVNETVGRAHARFRLDVRTGDYSIYDDGSRNGTWIVRRGVAIAVPSRDPRGVRIESGDEVRLGRALIRVAIVVTDGT
jgi:hypothetical protein